MASDIKIKLNNAYQCMALVEEDITTAIGDLLSLKNKVVRSSVSNKEIARVIDKIVGDLRR